MLLILLLLILFFINIENFILFKEKPKGYTKNLECKKHFNPVFKHKPYQVKIYTIPKILPNKKYNNPYLEIKKSDFNKLLNLIIQEDKNKFHESLSKFYEKPNYVYDYYSGIKSYKLDKIEIVSLVNYITNRINEKMRDKKYNLNIVNGYFTIHNFETINVWQNNIGETKYLLKLLLNRKTKKTAYEILCEIIINKNKYKVVNLETIGNTTLDNIQNIKPYNFSNQTLNIYRNFPNNPNFNYKNYYRDNDKHNFLFIPNNNKSIHQDIIKEKKDLIDIRSFKCFRGKYLYSPKEICENDKFLNGIKYKKRGIWDKLCKTNQECPFYKANKNYPNNFGGCTNGFCELPINMVNISPRLYSYKSAYKPYCYNCRDSTFDCCPTQKNLKLYPKLVTPDYAFPNDIDTRFKYKDILKKKGLEYNRILGKE